MAVIFAAVTAGGGVSRPRFGGHVISVPIEIRLYSVYVSNIAR